MLNQEQSQIEMTPEEAKASLGIATNLMDGLMPKAPIEPQDAPGQEESSLREQYPNSQQEGQESSSELTEIKNEIQELRKEVEKSLNDNDIKDLKSQIEAALNDDGE